MGFFTIPVTPVVVSGENPNSVVVLLYEISYFSEPCYNDIVQPASKWGVNTLM